MTKQSKPQASDEQTISMDAARTKRFFTALLQATDAVTSLQSVTSMFPLVGTSKGEVDPIATVTAFTGHLDDLLGLMQSMANNEEHLDDALKEAGHG